MIKKLYTKYIKNKFFNRIFIIYSAISVISILVVALMASNHVHMSLMEKERHVNDQVLNSVQRYLEQRLAASRSVMQQIYMNLSLYQEVTYLMKNGYDKHLEYKLDKYSNSRESSYYGFEKHFEACLSNSKDIIGIGIYSKSLKKAFVFSGILRNADPDTFFRTDIHPAVPYFWGNKILPAHRVKYYTPKGDSMAFTILYPVMDRYSLENLGVIAFDYDLETLQNLILKEESFKGNIIVYTEDRQVLFDSEGKGYQSQPLQSGNLDKSGHGDITSMKNFDESGTTIIVTTPKTQVVKGASKITKTIFIISVFCIIGAVFLSYLTMVTFSNRIKLIIKGFKSIRNGELSSRIPIHKQKDEISEIAADFNAMCDDVENYIEKIYVSEIKQKTAELKALQAQINPHFLYNTLEAIRMKAVARGVDEVGDMIYLLSQLFRSTVKGKTVVTIKEELEYSRMYLELFGLRYRDRLCVNFDIGKGADSYGIIKHAVQPLIENCMKHGANMTKGDNRIIIRVYKEDKEIFIHVIDNGRGMEEQKLNQLKQSLGDSKHNGDIGLGLVNVNERIRLTFGRQYGIHILSGQGTGTEVVLKIPAKTKEELEEDVQGVYS